VAVERWIAVVLEQHAHAIAQAGPADPLGRVGVLLGGDRGRRHAAAVARGGVLGEAAPAGADLEHVVRGRELELGADPLELAQRGLLERGRGRVEDGAGVHHRAVEELREQLVAEVVMGGDPLARPCGGVARQPAGGALKRSEHGGEGATQPVDSAHVERADARQRDEVGAVPQPAGVGLAEPEAAAQEVAVEVRRVDV
jgi:hypothetical protein